MTMKSKAHKRKADQSSSGKGIIFREPATEVDANVSEPPIEPKPNKKTKEIGQRVQKSVPIIKCRPATLCQVIESLNEVQRQAVRSIGFGGLLNICDLKYIPWSKMVWFFTNFNANSRVLKFSNGKTIALTVDDVQDVFLLPTHHDNDVCFLKKDDNDNTNVYLEEFKNRLELDTFSLGKVSELLRGSSLTNGGDDFKRLFVLYSFSCFLAPSLNHMIDHSIFKSLVDVDKICTFNWSKYVLEKLCSALKTYPKKNSGGCLLVIPILYFHRFMWLGVAEPCTLPLIRHWTSKKLKDRLEAECATASSFGVGKWVESTMYPRSKPMETNDNDDDDDAIAVNLSDDVDESPAHVDEEDDQYIKYKLPPSEKTNSDIKKIAKDGLHESFLLLQRDLSVITQMHLARMEKLRNFEDKKSEEEKEEPRCATAAHSMPIDEDDVFNDREFHRQIYKLVEQFQNLKKCPKQPEVHKSMSPPNFNPMTPTPEEKVGDDDICMVKKDKEKKYKGKDVEHLGVCYMNLDGASELKKASTIEGCSMNPFAATMDDFLVEFGGHKYVSSFVKKNKRYLLDFKEQELIIVDFCFHNLPRKLEKNVFAYREKFYLSFAAIKSLKEASLIDSMVIDVYSILLNEYNKYLADNSSTEIRRLYFSTQQSSYLRSVANANDEKTRKTRGEKLICCWKYWLERLDAYVDIFSADMFFFPVCHQDHFYAAVINLKNKKIQYLDNQKDNVSEDTSFWKLVKIVKEHFALYLDIIKHPKANEIKDYAIENVAFMWQSSKINLDCGVFVIHQMENFVGRSYECKELIEPISRRCLRAQYCTRIVTSTMNDLKETFFHDVAEFIRRSKT